MGYYHVKGPGDFEPEDTDDDADLCYWCGRHGDELTGADAEGGMRWTCKDHHVEVALCCMSVGCKTEAQISTPWCERHDKNVEMWLRLGMQWAIDAAIKAHDDAVDCQRWARQARLEGHK